MLRKVEVVPHDPNWLLLAEKYPNDIESYMDGKSDFIQEIDRKAAEWRRQNSS